MKLLYLFQRSSLIAAVISFPRLAESAANTQPEELVSIDGRLDVVLDVSFELSLDETRFAANYNGKPMGPTLRVKPGDTLSVTLNNLLPPGSDLDRELYTYTHDPQNEIDDLVNMTTIYNRLDEVGNIGNPTFGNWGLNYLNLHFHGADFPDDIEVNADAIDGGESKTYTFEIPMDQEPGLMWYHNHFHGTTLQAYMSGLYGFIVIEGTPEDVTSGIKENYTETFLMLGEFNQENNVTLAPKAVPFAFSFGWTHTTNGFDGAKTTLEYQENELILFRIASATTFPNMPLSIRFQPDDGSDEELLKFLPIAYDGFPVPSLKVVDTVEIGGGQRIEFLVRFEKPGTYILHRAGWASDGLTGVDRCNATFGAPVPRCLSFDVDKVVATISITASDTNATTTPLNETITVPEVSTYFKALAAMEPVDTKFVTFDTKRGFPLFQIPYDGPFRPPGFAFGANGLFVTPFQSVGTVQAGTCETWVVVNVPPGGDHPFHMHATEFMVTHIDGVAVEEPYWRDTEIVYSANITIHVCFDRNKPGDRVLFHCHMPAHHDVGMAGYYSVVAATTPETAAPITPSPVSTSPVSMVPSSRDDEECFSGNMLVEVKGRGSIPMSELALGDYVLSSSSNEGKYEEVYSFGHRNEVIIAAYLRFLPSKLEITPNHMIIIESEDGNNNIKAVPASTIRVGDRLKGSGMTVTAIQSVFRTGLYAPFTTSGTIVVNGVDASCYMAFQDSHILTIGNIPTGLSYQWLAHSFELPHRVWCGFFDCSKERYNEVGVSTWVEGPLQVTRWFFAQDDGASSIVLAPSCRLWALTMPFILTKFLADHFMMFMVASGCTIVAYQISRVQLLIK